VRKEVLPVVKRIVGLMIVVVSALGVAFWLYCIFGGRMMGKVGA
jgi:hypothetical protein